LAAGCRCHRNCNTSHPLANPQSTLEGKQSFPPGQTNVTPIACYVGAHRY
jgi:hypothetical protein